MPLMPNGNFIAVEDLRARIRGLNVKLAVAKKRDQSNHPVAVAWRAEKAEYEAALSKYNAGQRAA